MLSLLTHGLDAAFSTLIANEQNRTNLQMNRETNEANLQQVRETNSANAQQADLAYQRSLPYNQVMKMMQAGMSKPAALSALSGGGTYTAPTLQSASLDRPQVDYSGYMSAAEKLANIPANAQQFEIQQTQLQDLKADLIRKQEQHEAQINALNERLERERDEEYRKKYGQNQVEMTDKLASLIIEKAAQKGLDYSSYTDEAQLVKDLDLNHERLWRTAPDVARQKVRETLVSRANEMRANESNERARIAADDAHRKSLIDLAISQANLNELEKSLVYKLQILANNVALGKYQVDGAHKDAIIRDSGFKDEREAKKAMQIAEKLEQQQRRDKASTLTGISPAKQALYAIEWTLDRVNPLKSLFK